jgi:hypothetical protein
MMGELTGGRRLGAISWGVSGPKNKEVCSAQRVYKVRRREFEIEEEEGEEANDECGGSDLSLHDRLIG